MAAKKSSTRIGLCSKHALLVYKQLFLTFLMHFLNVVNSFLLLMTEGELLQLVVFWLIPIW